MPYMNSYTNNGKVAIKINFGPNYWISKNVSFVSLNYYLIDLSAYLPQNISLSPYQTYYVLKIHNI